MDIGQILFLRVYRLTELRSNDLQKKEQGQYPATLTEEAWSIIIKDLLFGFLGNLYSGTLWVVPNGFDSSILPAQAGSQSQCVICFILPAHGAS